MYPEAKNNPRNNTEKQAFPPGLTIERGETQINVNYTVLEILLSIFSRDKPLKVLDLPCGTMNFLGYVQKVFPSSDLLGADIVQPEKTGEIKFVRMDLSRNFILPPGEQYDLITSVSGVMMFSNTQSFIENCALLLKQNGTFILTNDNAATIIDRLAYLFLGRFRIFRSVFEDSEALTENVPVQELCRLCRKNGIDIENIVYTSFYIKDLIYLPIVILVYPFQLLYLLRLKTHLPRWLVWKMYPFKHLFCKHYIITGKKK